MSKMSREHARQAELEDTNMPCPTCSGTLQLSSSPDISPVVRHCDRCGTLTLTWHRGSTDTHVPKLVERCREYERTEIGADERPRWDTLGIAESIHTPDGSTVKPDIDTARESITDATWRQIDAKMPQSSDEKPPPSPTKG